MSHTRPVGDLDDDVAPFHGDDACRDQNQGIECQNRSRTPNAVRPDQCQSEALITGK